MPNTPMPSGDRAHSRWSRLPLPGPCPLCAPAQKRFLRSPLVSMETWEPSPYPRLPRGTGRGGGTRSAPGPNPQPPLTLRSSQREGDLPGALAAQQAEEQSAATRCQHAEAGECPRTLPDPVHTESWSLGVPSIP